MLRGCLKSVRCLPSFPNPFSSRELSITQKSLKRMPYKPFRDQLHLHQSQLLGCFRLNQEANSRFVRFPIADWLKLAII